MLPGLTASALAFLAAALVYTTAPHRMLNRVAGLVLFVDGIHILTSGLVSFVILADVPSSFGAVALHFILDAVEIPLYLAFVGQALDTPLTRPFRSPRVLALVSLPVAAFVGLMLLSPLSAVSRTFPVDHWYWRSWVEPGRAVQLVLLGAGLTFFFTLVAALDAWRRARSERARRQARAYVFAFGVRDLGWSTVFLTAFALISGAVQPATLGATLDLAAVVFVFMGFCVLLFPPLLVYGILRSQLFDIDLKVKWTLRQSTVAAVFVGVFFMASEGAQQFLGETLGSAYVGIAAAGLLVFALAPLQRLAERVSDAALPHVRDTAEYRTVRKREVYRAAVESALEDGAITDKERNVLATLADQLGLSSKEALDLEREASRGVA